MALAGARRALFAIAAALLAFGAFQIASASWIHAKAVVAQHLISSSWRQALDAGNAPRRPWPWADMRAIARLSVPARGIELYIMDSAGNNALAFGPAHVSGTAAPGSWGNAVIVGHRDTHFAFLRNLAPDDEVDIEIANGNLARYRVRDVAIVDKSETRVLDPADSAQLTLITCYPFDAVRPGTALRYVVTAERTR